MPYSRATEADIWYETSGDGPAMLLIHANPFDHNLWLYQIAHFSTWYRVVAVDIRGYGRSTKTTTPYALQDMGRDVLGCAQTGTGKTAAFVLPMIDILNHGRAKARRKGADLLVVNAVGEGLGFGTADNDVVVLDGSGDEVARAAGSKDDVAHAVWDAIVPLLAPAG